MLIVVCAHSPSRFSSRRGRVLARPQNRLIWVGWHQKKILSTFCLESGGSFFFKPYPQSTQEPYKNGVEAYATVAEGVLSSAGLMRGSIAVTLAVSAGDRVFSRCVRFAPPCARAACHTQPSSPAQPPNQPEP